ncbi:phosphate/phosphite/phosphonate ABC transporter substrate-binding protein [Dethiosulfovibrio sp. F2B]|uniref:phosphate/phosphite/phosphonate ABC transporter substrate-binding protein n=1 Tax=Dethiosulfovibrio faecalis TaxID=2720018 RepID=UPI001F1745C0|nr:phosphate/phosphite/phosphonate ABC transporter substrate-binding protein [Dethiosulfovibrio faecalis]MCF4152359.1 phosphate/phosphite/phosphonate ABC transporter substrate-binding protein [Dethiosulfovibrio faecalis]
MSLTKGKVAIAAMSFVFVFISSILSPAFGAHYRFGVFPGSDPAKIEKAMGYLADCMNRVGDDDISIVVTRDYGELLSRMLEGSLDFAFINTVNYVELKSKMPGVRYMVTLMKRTDAKNIAEGYYYSYIVSLRNRGFSSVQDLKDGSFAFVDRSSSSGYVYPRYTLDKMGIVPDDFFKKVYYLSRHDRVVKALLAGSVDGGAISDGMYSKAVEMYGDMFSVLAVSDPIPLDLMVASDRVPETKVEEYVRALLRLSSNSDFRIEMEALFGWYVEGFCVLDDSVYDKAREVLDFEG